MDELISSIEEAAAELERLAERLRSVASRLPQEVQSLLAAERAKGAQAAPAAAAAT